MPVNCRLCAYVMKTCVEHDQGCLNCLISKEDLGKYKKKIKMRMITEFRVSYRQDIQQKVNEKVMETSHRGQ